MQLRHDDFGGGNALFLVHANRDAAAIVFDRDRSIGVKLDQHQVAVPRQCFIDRIVRDFENHVVQARTIIGIADIHAGAFAYCIKAFEDLDRIGTIFALLDGFFRCIFRRV